MFAVTSPAKGVLEINYMWLPSWVGMNSVLLEEMGKDVSTAVTGLTLDEALEVGHGAVINFLVHRYPHITGLANYLNALKLVSINAQETEEGR